MRKASLLVLLCWVSQAWSDGATDMFQKKLQAIRTMQATFSQVIHSNTREISRSSGEMALARPGRFRWQTLHPMPQLVLADGTRLWVYDVDLEQVTVKKQAHGMEAGAGLFLSDDEANWSKSFDISVKQTGHHSDFDLRSKSGQTDFKHVTFQFEGDVLSGMELFDPLGQHTTVHFKHIKTNLALPASVFQFTPPKGVDVVDEGGARGSAP